MPILGVIRPAVKEAVQLTRSGRIGIIGTRATVESMSYQREIKRINPGFKAFVQACPLFVPLSEEGWIDDEVTLRVARRYLGAILKKDIDTLILGCTHYPLLKNIVRKAVGKRIEFVDSAKKTAQEAKGILIENNLCTNRNSRMAKCKFYVSDAPAVFRKVGRRFLGKRIKSVQKV